MFIRFDVIHECDGQTDRHCMTAKTALAEHRAVKMWAVVRENGDFLHLRFE